MKIKTAEAARKLSLHPAHLLLFIAELDRSLKYNEIWPEIEQEWIETIAITSGHIKSGENKTEKEKALVPDVKSVDGLSKKAFKLLDKLYRHGKWGHVSVTNEALINMTRLSSRELEEAVGELERKGYLIIGSRNRGKISLEPDRKKEINASLENINE